MEIIGAVSGIAGALLIASNTIYTKWGFVMFMISGVSLGIMGYRQKMYHFVTMQMIFQVINIIGVINYF
jgi:nicotinamide riboside transporter PnuC